MPDLVDVLTAFTHPRMVFAWTSLMVLTWSCDAGFFYLLFKKGGTEGNNYSSFAFLIFWFTVLALMFSSVALEMWRRRIFKKQVKKLSYFSFLRKVKI